MTQASSTPTPEGEPPAPASPEPGPSQSPEGPASAGAEAQATPAAESDDIYTQAFDQFLAPNASGQEGDANPPATPDSSQANPEAQPGQQGETAPQQTPETPAQPELSHDQVQLLRRNHMTPEMVASWTPGQRQEFLDNAAKREADQTRNYQQLQQQLREQQQGQQSGGQQQGQQDGQTPDGGQQQDQQTPEATPQGGALAQQAQKVVDELVDVYGEEIKPLGEVTTKLGQTVDQLQQQLEQSQTAAQSKDHLIVEMTIDSGVRDLIGEFPSLEKADVRQRVVQRFTDEWKSPGSKHRTGEGSILDRVRSALRDAAAAEFGNQTESAAQVALANTTKDRLQQQPHPGSGNGRQAPATEDDVYDQAFVEHLKPDR